MDGWARMADTAHTATTFEELRAAGAEFGKVLGEDAARARILAVATLAGHTLGHVVDVMATEREARGPCTLILWDAERQRTVTLGNVTFP
jgi:hypothetical protein